MLGLIIAAAVSVAEPQPAPGPLSECDRRPGCRHISTFELRDRDGKPQTIHVNADLEFADADGKLILLPGEMVTVALEPRAGGKNLALVVLEKWSADALPVFAIDEMFANGAPVPGPAPEGTAEVFKARTLPDGAVRLTFRQLPGKPDTVLIVESGYGQALDYRAVMLPFQGRREPTSVCEVLPRLTSYEHWPYPIVSIELDAFRFLEGEKSEVVCD